MTSLIRKDVSADKRIVVLEKYDFKCVYCLDDATQIDHVKPYSWDMDNDYENLVACCPICNAVAGNKLFDSFDSKKEYILSTRQSLKCHFLRSRGILHRFYQNEKRLPQTLHGERDRRFIPPTVITAP